jgi:hypothetical protein
MGEVINQLLPLFTFKETIQKKFMVTRKRKEYLFLFEKMESSRD